MDFGNAFDVLTSEDFAVEAGAVAAGFGAPELVRYGIENQMGRDLPDEVYGGGVVIGGAVVGGHGRHAAIGGAVHTLNSVRKRVMEGQ